MARTYILVLLQATRPTDLEVLRDSGVFLFYLKRTPGEAAWPTSTQGFSVCPCKYSSYSLSLWYISFQGVSLPHPRRLGCRARGWADIVAVCVAHFNAVHVSDSNEAALPSRAVMHRPTAAPTAALRLHALCRPAECIDTLRRYLALAPPDAEDIPKASRLWQTKCESGLGSGGSGAGCLRSFLPAARPLEQLNTGRAISCFGGVPVPGSESQLSPSPGRAGCCRSVGCWRALPRNQPSEQNGSASLWGSLLSAAGARPHLGCWPEQPQLYTSQVGLLLHILSISRRPFPFSGRLYRRLAVYCRQEPLY